MAQKTSVDGNKVTIDEYVYELKPTTANPNKYSVKDEFGGSLGHITIEGRNLDVEDYGVQGAHPLAQIAKLYRDAQGGVEAKRPASRMICQIHTFDKFDPAEMEKAHAYRRWLKTQPGLKTAFFTYDATTTVARSIRVWSSREQMAVATNRAPPAGASEPTPSSVEVTLLAEDI